MFFIYSSLNASIGLIIVALVAGINPINDPKTTRIIKETKTINIETDAFTNTESGPWP